MSGLIESYEQALAFLHGRINYERTSAALSATDFKLERMRHLLDRIGNPQETLPAVHIAGTKGKGSTAVMIAESLAISGYDVGLFTSPHLERFEERIRVNGEPIGQADFVELTNLLAGVTAKIDEESQGLNPTFFELTTALGWLYFQRRSVQIVVLEVGLGGRLDSTNLCRPEVTVITTISRDHVQVLGHRLSQIAAEKCGIIKPGIPVVSGVTLAEARQVVQHFARERSAPLRELGHDFDYNVDQPGLSAVVIDSGNMRLRLPLPIAGQHQAHNAAVAVEALYSLDQRGWTVAWEALPTAFARIRWPARIERIDAQPIVILDAAHNWASVTALVETLAAISCSGPRCLIASTTKDKDSLGLLRRLLPAFDSVIVTQYQTNPRAVAASELQRMISGMSLRGVHQAATPAEAWRAAVRIMPPDGMICVAGSFFLAAELRSLACAQAAMSH